MTPRANGPPRFELRRFLSVRSCTQPGFSPGGGRVAFLTEVTGVPQLWSVDTAGGWPEQLSFYAERVGGALYSPVEDRIAFAMDMGGDEHHQLYVVDGAGVTVRPLTAAPRVIHHLGAWSPDGHHLAYSANRRDARHFDVHALDLESGSSRALLEAEGMNLVERYTPDGGALLVNRHNTNFDSDLFLIDLAGGAARHLTPHRGEAEFDFPYATPDGAGLLLATDRDRDFFGVAYLDLADLSLTYLDEPPWDVEALALSPDGRRLAYVVNEDGYSALTVREVRRRDEVGAVGEILGPALVLPPLPRGTISQLAFSPAGDRLAFVRGGARDNGDVWTLDVDGVLGGLRQVTNASRAGIPREALVEPELVRYRSFDGLEIPAFFFRPPHPGDGPPPVVLWVHGGPESQFRPTYNGVIQYLAHRGYAVLATNVRGSTGYGKRYSHLDDVRRRMDSVADLKHAHAWLAESGAGDPRRVAVMGGSYGGFMVLAALTTYSELWAAGVDIVGIANFVTFLENTGPWRRKLREAEYGSLERDRDFLREISPINHVDRIAAPLLVIHGANDPRVPLGEAEQIVSSIRARGGVVEYLPFSDEGHGLVKLVNRVAGYTAAVDFLDRHLGERR